VVDAVTEPRTKIATLGLFDATTLVAGSMIGSGIFLVSADIANLTASPGWLLAVWLFAGVLNLTAALSCGELAAMFPHAGGQYVFLREAFGPAAAFLFGWTQLLVIQTGTIAAVAVAFAQFSGVLFPSLTNRMILGIGTFGITPQGLVAIALIVGLTWSNQRSLSAGKGVQNVFTVAKALVLVALILVPFVTAGSREGTALHQEPFFGTLPVATLGPAMVGALFAAAGWEQLTFAAGEVREPRKNLPGALLLGTAAVIALYLAVNVAYLSVLPMHALVDIARAHSAPPVASAMVEAAAGKGPAILVAVGIIVSAFGCTNGYVLAGARVSYAMAKDGRFFSAAGRLNGRGVPGIALWMQAGWSALLCLSGTYSDLLAYVIFATLAFYALTVLAVFALRRKAPDLPRPYRVLGYPWLPGAYVVAATVICASLLVSEKTRTHALAGLLCVLSGAPVYVWLSRRISSASRTSLRRPAGE
jgi:basic amino acid/polyamine antiporter, APA family